MRHHCKSVKRCFAFLKEARHGSGNDPERMQQIARAELALKELNRMARPTHAEIFRQVHRATEALVKAFIRSGQV